MYFGECVCLAVPCNPVTFVCFRELVKLFCTEISHRKDLMHFLTGLITSLDVSDIWSLQALITNPYPVKRVIACSWSFMLSFSILSITHSNTQTTTTTELTIARINRPFPWRESRLHYRATSSHLCRPARHHRLWTQRLQPWSLSIEYPILCVFFFFVQQLLRDMQQIWAALYNWHWNLY